jgi:hypothetical protein
MVLDQSDPPPTQGVQAGGLIALNTNIRASEPGNLDVQPMQGVITGLQPMDQQIGTQPVVQQAVHQAALQKVTTQQMLQVTQLNIHQTQVQLQVSTQTESMPIFVPITLQQPMMQTQQSPSDQRQQQDTTLI